jgi:hypothetical protein
VPVDYTSGVPRVLIVFALLAGAKKVHVSGTATHVHETWPCLGGVRITPEMVHRKTQLLGQAEFTLYAGDTGAPTGPPVARLKTDAKGQFSIDLAPGAYCVVQGAPAPRPDAGVELESAALEPSPDSEAECLRQLDEPKCAARIDVPPSGTTEASFHVYSRNQCNQPWARPCYRGPAPP